MLQRFLDPAVLAGLRPGPGGQDRSRRLHLRPAPFARFRLQPGVRGIPRLQSRRRSAARGLERLRAHGAHVSEALSRRNQLPGERAAGHQRVHEVRLAAGWRSWSTRKFLAASVLYLAHLQRDAAGLIVFDDEVRNFVPPSTRQGQLHRLLHGVDQAAAGQAHRLVASRSRT